MNEFEKFTGKIFLQFYLLQKIKWDPGLINGRNIVPISDGGPGWTLIMSCLHVGRQHDKTDKSRAWCMERIDLSPEPVRASQTELYYFSECVGDISPALPPGQARPGWRLLGFMNYRLVSTLLQMSLISWAPF